MCGTSGCSEIKTPRFHPLTKVSGLISDIRKMKKQHRKKKKLSYKFFIITLTLLIISFIVFFVILVQVTNHFTIIEKKIIPASLTVYDHYGFDVNPYNLTFGMLMPGSSARKELIIENKYNFPIKVKIIPKQDMRKFIEVKEHIISKNRTEKITISAYVPADTAYGNYTGEVVVVIKKRIYLANFL